MSTPDWVKHAYFGQKVVCVDSGIVIHDPRNWFLRTFKPLRNPLVEGVTYTISAILPNNNYEFGVAIRLCEFEQIDGIAINCNPEQFRPLQSKSTETGMSMIRKLLHTKELVE